MAIISAEEWLKRQNTQQSRPATTTSTSGGIISAKEWLKTHPEEKEKQKQVVQAAQKEAPKPSTPRVEIEKPRIIPRDIGSFFGSGLIEDFLLEPAGKAEDFLRLLPAAGFEGARAIDIARGAGTEALNTNPFAPGLEKAGPGRLLEEIGRRSGGAAAAATLAKFPFKIGALKSLFPSALIGSGFTASEPDTGAGDIALSGAISAPFGPAGIYGTRGAQALLRTLKPVPTFIAANIPGKVAALETVNAKIAAIEKSAQKQLPAKAQSVSESGAVIEVPPGGFSAFEPTGVTVGRQAVTDVSTAAPETVGLTLMKSLLGKSKVKKIQKQILEETVPDPSPDITRISQKPTGQRPPPVRKEFSREVPGIVATETKSVKITDPVINASDDVLNNATKVEKEAKPFAAQERVPGEQFEFTTITAKNPLLSRLFDSIKERVRGSSPSGRRLAISMDRAEALARTRRGETIPLRNQITDLFKKMSVSQKTKFYADREAGVIGQDAKSIQLNSLLTQYFGKRQAQANQFGILIDDFTLGPLGDPLTYLPHRLNELGNKLFHSNPNKFFEVLAKKNKITPEQARVVYSRFVKKGEPVQSFEKERKLLLPDEWLEKDVIELVRHYENQFSRRIATAEVFGKDVKSAYDLAGKIGQETGSQNDTDLAVSVVEEMMGLKSKDIAGGRFVDDLIQNAVRSKLSILTASKNIFQGFNAINTSFGPKAAWNGLFRSFTKEGNIWARDVGVAAGEGFYQNTPNGKLFKIQDFLWRKTSGFAWTEDKNFVQAAIGSKDALNAIAKALIKKPNNTALKNKLELWGIDANMVIRNGGIPEKELRIASANYAIKSIFPKVAGTMTEWANVPLVGRATYLFFHYLFNQGRFMQENFKLGKVEGIKALGRLTVSAAVSGEIALGAQAALFGKERPENIFARIMEDEAAIISTVPYALVESAGYGRSGFANLGGPIVSGVARTGSEVAQEIGAGDLSGAFGALGTGYLRGDIPPVGPIPPAPPQGSLLEQIIRDQGKKSSSKTSKTDLQKEINKIYGGTSGVDKSDLQKELDKIYSSP